MRLAKQVRNCPAPVGLRLRDRAATRRIIEVSKQQAETAALHVGRICGNSDLPSGREVVSTESYLLSPAVDRI